MQQWIMGLTDHGATNPNDHAVSRLLEQPMVNTTHTIIVRIKILHSKEAAY